MSKRASSSRAFGRDAAIERLGRERFDVLVVGGGITGAGVALDAAARGLRTAMVERADFASGTSSKSSKLVHGGLRYLQQREFRLVYENLAERQRLLRNATHLVSPLTFLIPLFGSSGTVNKSVARVYGSALWVYDLTGGLRIGKRHRRLGAAEISAHLPTLRTDRLVAGYLYYDAQADDARLTLAIARTACLDHGAVAANYLPLTAFLKDAAGKVTGAKVSVLDPERPDAGAFGKAGASRDIDVSAAVVVNATGVWADEVRALDEGSHPRSIRPAKGIHVTVPRSRLPCDVAAVLPVSHDHRTIFVVPWEDEVYLGTTDTDYDGSLDQPACTPEDVSYVLDAVNAFLSEPLSADEVTGTWAGLRPLLSSPAGASLSARTADLSRRHQVTVSPSGLVNVTGGKLTTYRKMAADTVDEVVKALGRGTRHSPTRRLRLRGANGTAALRRPGAAARLGVDPEVLEHLVSRYGSEATDVLALAEAEPALAEPLVPGLANLRAEAVFAARSEMAVTLDDVVARRTRALLHRREATVDAASSVADLLATELGWTPEVTARQVAAVTDRAESGASAAGLRPPAPPGTQHEPAGARRSSAGGPGDGP